MNYLKRSLPDKQDGLHLDWDCSRAGRRCPAGSTWDRFIVVTLNGIVLSRGRSTRNFRDQRRMMGIIVGGSADFLSLIRPLGTLWGLKDAGQPSVIIN